MISQNWFAELKTGGSMILPSLLQCDFANLEREVQRLEAAGTRALHLDVMDGNFVPNLTYGLPVVAALRRVSTLPLDVHLMIDAPERYVREFRDAGADLITVHAEATENLQAVLQQIRDCGAKAGIAVNPQTRLESIESALKSCDLLLVMSVEAGFGGQEFQPAALEKIRRARNLVGAGCVLEVDGGVNASTIGDCAAAGADWMVVGSAIFRHGDYGQAIAGLRQRIDSDPL